jgi:hypothetical protein
MDVHALPICMCYTVVDSPELVFTGVVQCGPQNLSTKVDAYGPKTEATPTFC